MAFTLVSRQLLLSTGQPRTCRECVHPYSDNIYFLWWVGCCSEHNSSWQLPCSLRRWALEWMHCVLFICWCSFLGEVCVAVFDTVRASLHCHHHHPLSFPTCRTRLWVRDDKNRPWCQWNNLFRDHWLGGRPGILCGGNHCQSGGHWRPCPCHQPNYFD